MSRSAAFPFAMLRPVFVWLLIALGACATNDILVPFNCGSSDLALTLVSTLDATSCSATDGSIVVSASGGMEPYSFRINGTNAQGKENFTGLNPGIYSLSVTDGNQCVARISNITVFAAGFSVTADVGPDNMCLGGDGSIAVTVTDGSPPFQYRMGDGAYMDGNSFEGLQEGDHVIRVKDNNNCEVQLNITVPHGFTGVSWINDILPIIEAKCSINSCHDGRLRPDLRRYEKASFYSGLMKELTQNGSMPFEGSLTPDQIDRIACWVDDGALQN